MPIYVYVATNPNIFPPCVKIGYTNDIDRRMKELSKASLGKWECYSYETYLFESEARCVELQLHRLFKRANCKNNNPSCPTKELFYACPKHVTETLEEIGTNCMYNCSCRFNSNYRVIRADVIKSNYDKWITSNEDMNNACHTLRRCKKNAEQLMEIIYTYAENFSNGDYVKVCNILKEIHEPNL